MEVLMWLDAYVPWSETGPRGALLFFNVICLVCTCLFKVEQKLNEKSEKKNKNQESFLNEKQNYSSNMTSTTAFKAVQILCSPR